MNEEEILLIKKEKQKIKRKRRIQMLKNFFNVRYLFVVYLVVMFVSGYQVHLARELGAEMYSVWAPEPVTFQIDTKKSMANDEGANKGFENGSTMRVQEVDDAQNGPVSNSGDNTRNTENNALEEQIIRETAREAGFNDEDLLVAIAMCESGSRKAGYINANAKNKNSTASGVFQYLKGTWEEGVRKTGNDWTLDDRYDVEKSTRMAIFHISTGKLSKWNSSKSCWS